MGENAFLHDCQEEDKYTKAGPAYNGNISTKVEGALLQPSYSIKRTANKNPMALAGQAIA